MSNTTKKILHLMALLCVGAVGIALISQHMFGMRPCAWCVFQRFIFLAIAVFCWLGIIVERTSFLRRLCALLATLLSIGGITAAWYQYNVAAKMFSCDQTFADRFMVQSGLDANIPWLFGIFATCMDARVTLLGLEYVVWSMILFVVLALLGLVALTRRA